MADYVIKNIKISNPNNVAVSLNYGTSESDLNTTVSIDANSNLNLNYECDDTTLTLYFKLTADDYKDSQIVSKTFTYNPLQDVEVSISGGYDSTTGMYVETIKLTNLSPVDLTLNGIQEGDIVFGEKYSSSNTNFIYTTQDLDLVSGASGVYVKVQSSYSSGSYDFYIRDLSGEYESVEYKG